MASLSTYFRLLAVISFICASTVSLGVRAQPSDEVI
jgi:hypothetical protein